jgi:hypothetical protein
MYMKRIQLEMTLWEGTLTEGLPVLAPVIIMEYQIQVQW